MTDDAKIVSERLRQSAAIGNGFGDPDGFAWSQAYRLDVARLLAERDTLRDQRDQAQAEVGASRRAVRKADELLKAAWERESQLADAALAAEAETVSLRDQRDRWQKLQHDALAVANEYAEKFRAAEARAEAAEQALREIAHAAESNGGASGGEQPDDGR